MCPEWSISRLPISATRDPRNHRLPYLHLKNNVKRIPPIHTLKMPPKHPKPPNHLIKPADRLALAITGLKTGKYTSIHEAATQNAVPESTLRARVKSAGFRFPRRAGANNKNTRRKEFRLTRTEENTLSNWIIQVHEGGKDISPGLIHSMANTLLAKRGGTHGFRVTAGWVAGYLDFHPEFAALVEEHNENAEKELGVRPVNLRHDPENPKDTLELAETIVHNTTQFAKNMNEVEKDLQEGLKELMATEPDRVREIVAAFEQFRQGTGWVFWKGVDQCHEMRELTLGFDIDTSAFVKGYEELLSIIDDTKRVQEEIRVEFGEKVPVEEES